MRASSRATLVLATATLAREEIFAVVDAAVDAGIETIVVTNPEFPSHRLSPADSSGSRAAARCSSAR